MHQSLVGVGHSTDYVEPSSGGLTDPKTTKNPDHLYN